MSRLELKDTVELMGSSDYRDRFVAEYIQLKIRYEKLKAFNTKIEAACRTQNAEEPQIKVFEPVHSCPASLLREQQAEMGQLLHILEVRAVIEDIDLTDAMMYLEEKKKKDAKDAAGASPRPTEDPELKLKLEDYDSDWEIVEEAVGRVLEKRLFDDSDEEKLIAAAVNVLYRVKKLEESSEKTKERHCDKCVHLPICEYCSVHLKGFTLPDNKTCDMYLRVKEGES